MYHQWVFNHPFDKTNRSLLSVLNGWKPTSRKTDFVRTSSGPKLRHRFVVMLDLYMISRSTQFMYLGTRVLWKFHFQLGKPKVANQQFLSNCKCNNHYHLGVDVLNSRGFDPFVHVRWHVLSYLFAFAICTYGFLCYKCRFQGFTSQTLTCVYHVVPNL